MNIPKIIEQLDDPEASATLILQVLEKAKKELEIERQDMMKRHDEQEKEVQKMSECLSIAKKTKENQETEIQRLNLELEVLEAEKAEAERTLTELKNRASSPSKEDVGDLEDFNKKLETWQSIWAASNKKFQKELEEGKTSMESSTNVNELLNAKKIAVMKRCDELNAVESDLDQRDAALNEEKDNLIENAKLPSVGAKLVSENDLSDGINWIFPSMVQLAEDESKLDADFDEDMKILEKCRSAMKHVDDPIILKLEVANVQVAQMIDVMQKILEEGKGPESKVNFKF